MAGELGPDENRHVSGLYTQMLVSYLQERLSPAAMGRVLLRAGESRDLEELSNISSWSSYQQFRRLLQEARLESDSVPDVLQSHYAMRTQNPEIAQSMHALGSPGAVLGMGDGSNPLVPIRRYVMTEVGLTEWTIGEGFFRWTLSRSTVRSSPPWQALLNRPF